MAELKNAAKRVDLYMVPIGLIDTDPDFNPRSISSPDTLAYIQSLAQQIKLRGFDPDRPVMGRYENERFIMTDGHCRLAAVKLLIEAGEPFEAIPARLEPKGTSVADRTLFALREPGRPLTSLEAAVAIKRLLGYGWEESAIASKLGKSKQWVLNCLELAAAPEEIKRAVLSGDIASSEAVKMVRSSEDPVAALETAREAAVARGSETIKPRDIQTAKPKKLNEAQKAIIEFLKRWDANEDDPEEDLTDAVDDLRFAVPAEAYTPPSKKETATEAAM